MTRTCFFFFRNPLNVSSVRWCTSLATSLQAFSGGGGGGGSFGLNIQTQTNKKLTERFWSVNNIRKMLGRLFTVSYFSEKGRDRASTLTGRQFVLKSTEASWGRVSNLPRGVGVDAQAKILRPAPSVHLKQRWPPVTQSARSRRSYGKIRDCEQSNYISEILGGPNSGNLKEDAPRMSKRKKGVTRKELKLYVKHEKWGVFYPTKKWVRGTWIWDETFFQFFFYY